MSTQSFYDTIMEYGGGNIKAVEYLLETFSRPDSDVVNALLISNKLKHCPSIRGTNIYVLYNDLCDGDIELVARLCETVPDETLEEACNRQDLSGQELIQEFME